MLRSEPYRLATELVRGQANKLRNIRVEWERDGWRASDDLEARAREVTSQLCHCLHQTNDPTADEKSIETLINTIRVGEEMTHHYSQWALTDRWGQQYPTHLGMALPADPFERSLALADPPELFTLPIDWSLIENESDGADWSALDRDIDACLSAGAAVQLGPILDFRQDRLPTSLAQWTGDPQLLVTLLVDRVETVIHQFADRVSRWVVTHRTNSTDLLPINDRDWEWLTARLLATGQAIQPTGRFAIGVDQPWGWYAGHAGKHVWPVDFLDSVLRQGVKPTAIYVDFKPGSHPLEPPRTVMDVVKLLSRYRRLETPLWVNLAGTFGPTASRDRLTRGVLAKPFVGQVTWDETASRETILAVTREANILTKPGLARPTGR
jgi:hypothetical protein